MGSVRLVTEGTPPQVGKFVVLEGPDGGGKSTQVKLLAEALQSKGTNVVATREPGGTPLGEKLRSVLLGDSKLEICPRAELFLFMAARAQIVEKVVNPALETGATVITDRFLLSSVVYQGLAGEIPAGEVQAIGRSATNGLTPHLTIVIDVDAETGLKRAGKGDRIESRGRNYHQKVRQGFLSLARRDPNRMAVVDGSQTISDVHDEILKLVEAHELG